MKTPEQWVEERFGAKFKNESITRFIREIQLDAIGTVNEKEALIEMDKAIANDDVEVAHSDADLILCQVLNDLGFTELVKKYHEVNKWYA